MPAAPSSKSGDLELAEGIVKAWLRRDVEWLLKRSVPDVELSPAMWTDVPFRGREGTIAFVMELLPAYEDLRLDVVGARHVEDRVELDVDFHAHMRDSHADLDDRFTFRFWIRDGKLARFKGYGG
jgi:SnoaL-like protein